jgi:hypothetical protein
MLLFLYCIFIRTGSLRYLGEIEHSKQAKIMKFTVVEDNPNSHAPTEPTWALCELICTSRLPFSILSDQAFGYFVQAAQKYMVVLYGERTKKLNHSSTKLSNTCSRPKHKTKHWTLQWVVLLSRRHDSACMWYLVHILRQECFRNVIIRRCLY